MPVRNKEYAKKKEFIYYCCASWGFPGGASGKEHTCSAGDFRDVVLIPESGRSPGGGNGNPLQYSCWRIPWAEKPGGLWFKGSQRVGCDWSNLAHMHAMHHIRYRWRCLSNGKFPSPCQMSTNYEHRSIYLSWDQRQFLSFMEIEGRETKQTLIELICSNFFFPFYLVSSICEPWTSRCSSWF